MNRNAKRGRLDSGPSPKDSAAGGKSAATVTQTGAETEQVAAVRDYWAAAKRRYLHGDYPEYATPEWRALDPEDPMKLAGVMAFAENWRKYHLDITAELDDALRPHPPIWQRPSLAELDQAHADIVTRNRHEARKEAA
ncbi:hypothetical protein OG432_30395 [Streptomyces sp. NBC_00442]|uniref:hypothetical protein n=1 Tax=Streptomyces sp. NBC_00442 TaxID=2903651 RepID=UPI002E1D8561